MISQSTISFSPSSTIGIFMHLTASMSSLVRRMYRIQFLFLAPILSFFLILRCSPPPTPYTVENAQVKLILKSSKNKVNDTYIEDSINTIVNIGAVINMPDYVDSIRITIKNEQNIPVMEKKLLANTGSGSDTVWFQHFFTTSSKYSVACIGYIAKGIIRSSEGTVQIYGLTVLNHKPLITVAGLTAIQSGETCNLTVTAADVDNNLTGVVTTIKGPAASLLSGTAFTWKTPATYSGIDTVRFVVTDNGTPPLSDTATILISVRPATASSEDRLVVSRNSTDTVFFTWKAIDKANQYYIYKTDKVTGTYILTDSVTTASYRDTILKETQGYVVKAINGQQIIWVSDTLITSTTIASDTTPPVISFPPPISDTMTITTSFFATTFTCKDSSGIRSVSCTVDSQPVPVTRLSDTVFLCSVSNLEPGKTYAIRFSACDKSFLSLCRDTTLRIKTVFNAKDTVKPTIERMLPEVDSSKTGQSSITAQFKCRDNKGISAVVCTLGVSIIAATKISDTVYSATISGLVAGANSIRVSATDSSGNGASLVFTVICDLSIGDKTPPSLECRLPLGGSGSVAKATALLEIFSVDFSGVKSVTGYLGSAIFIFTKSATNDSMYRAEISGLTAGAINTIKVIAIDNSINANKDSTFVNIKYDTDLKKPSLMHILPVSDSSTINASSVTVNAKAYDESGVASVVFILNDVPSSLVNGTRVPADSTWTAVVGGLVVKQLNKITIIATDSSLAANKDTFSFRITYDPTIEDSTGPSIIQIGGPASGLTVTSPVITIVDSIADPSGISSVFYTINGGTPKAMPVVTGKSDHYSFTDTLKKENSNTITIETKDNATKKNLSTQTLTLNYVIPPKITLQPKSQAVCNAQAVFSLTATGTGPLAYQWRKGASTFIPITGAVNPVCTLKTLTSKDNGTVLSCVVSNSSDTITSALCTLTVNTPSTLPDAAAAPSSICNDSAVLSVVSGTPGTGAEWKWYASSRTGTLLNITKVSPSVTTWYYVRGEGGPCGNTGWDSVLVTKNTLPSKPTLKATDSTVCSGSATTLTATGTPGTKGTWKWYTSKTESGLIPTTTDTLSVSPKTATTYFARGEGTCGKSAWDSITITVKNKPVIETEPTSVGGCLNGNAIFSVKVGTGSESATYQWLKGTEILTGKTNPSCTLITNTSTTGVYSCVVTNSCGSTTSNSATLTLNIESVAPTSVYDSVARYDDGNGKIVMTVHFIRVIGGSLGTGAQWVWYCPELSSGVVFTGSTFSFPLSPLSPTSPSVVRNYSVRAEGTCNTTKSASITISN
ncbi:MAG TPA: hypothetical protein VKO63_08440 [Chitinispirillaceae bacterium]|nr:hypothetical protein [Chitinispirillaceae bacterium]